MVVREPGLHLGSDAMPGGPTRIRLVDLSQLSALGDTQLCAGKWGCLLMIIHVPGATGQIRPLAGSVISGTYLPRTFAFGVVSPDSMPVPVWYSSL